MGSYNSIPFYKLVKGVLGRKVAYVDTDVITRENIVDVLATAVSVMNTNRMAINYLWDYYRGDQLILYRQKEQAMRDDIVNIVEENHAYEIVQFFVGQTYGEPIQYISRGKDESINEAIDKFNDYNHNAYKYQRNIMQGEWKSAVGTSYLGVQYADNPATPYRIVVPNPIETVIAYSKYTGEPVLSVQEMKDSDKETYYLCFSENKEFHVKNGVVILEQLHAFGGIPIVEIPNNQSRISDTEVVITELDAINTLQSNAVDGVEQFVQSLIVFTNVDLSPDTTIKDIRNQGALVIKSNNGSDNKASVDMLTTELNQSETQVLKDDVWKKVLSILAVPNQDASSNSGDTQGAVSLRNGWDHSKNRARLKDSYVVEAEKRLAKIILNVLRVSGQGLGITENDFSVTITHSPTDNLYTKTQALQSMLQSGVHPLIATATCGLWGDSEKVYIQSKPYFDALYKTVDDIESENQDGQNQAQNQTMQQPTEFKNMTGRPMEEL